LAYRSENNERLQALRKEWYAKPESLAKIVENNRRRKARMLGTTIAEVDYIRILERDGFWCHICCKDIDPTIKKGPARLVFDHMIPLQPCPGDPQGTHTEDNIKPSHYVCNSRKRNRILEDLTPFQRRGPD